MSRLMPFLATPRPISQQVDSRLVQANPIEMADLGSYSSLLTRLVPGSGLASSPVGRGFCLVFRKVGCESAREVVIARRLKTVNNNNCSLCMRKFLLAAGIIHRKRKQLIG